jgi:hypothetical protein
MNGGTLVRRSVLGASLIGGSALGAIVFAGSAYAHDQNGSVECVNADTGAWRATMSFSSVDVNEGHTAVVTFGSATATLHGPDETTASLSQDFSADQASATVPWSIVRNETNESSSGEETFTKPEGCVPETTTTVPESAPTTAPTTAPPASTPEAPSTTPASHVDPADLPVTGSATAETAALAALAIVAGGVIIRVARRRPDEVIGD